MPPLKATMTDPSPDSRASRRADRAARVSVVVVVVVDVVVFVAVLVIIILVIVLVVFIVEVVLIDRFKFQRRERGDGKQRSAFGTCQLVVEIDFILIDVENGIALGANGGHQRGSLQTNGDGNYILGPR